MVWFSRRGWFLKNLSARTAEPRSVFLNFELAGARQDQQVACRVATDQQVEDRGNSKRRGEAERRKVHDERGGGHVAFAARRDDERRLRVERRQVAGARAHAVEE